MTTMQPLWYIYWPTSWCDRMQFKEVVVLCRGMLWCERKLCPAVLFNFFFVLLYVTVHSFKELIPKQRRKKNLSTIVSIAFWSQEHRRLFQSIVDSILFFLLLKREVDKRLIKSFDKVKELKMNQSSTSTKSKSQSSGNLHSINRTNESSQSYVKQWKVRRHVSDWNE